MAHACRLLTLVALFLPFWGAPWPAVAQDAASGFGAELDAKAKDIRPQDIVQWAAFEAIEDADGKVQVLVRMSITNGWKVYASNLTFEGPSGFTVESVTPPPAQKFMDPISAQEVDVYSGGEFTITLAGAPRWTHATFPLGARFVGCTNEICLFPYTQPMDVPFKAYAAETAATAPAATSDTTPKEATPVDLETSLAQQLAGGGLSFSMMLLFVFLGGLLSNLTPCVYPMIPITLRLLARQGASPYLSATSYAAGIVVTYSILGMVAVLSGGLFGSLLASKGFNLTFAVIMAVLGASMLGFGDFSKLQALGNRLGTGKPSPKNAFLMGTGAGLVAAPCTGPILASLLAYTVAQNAGIGESMALLGTYSLGFGLPYIALGGAAAKISQVKVPPHVQIGVKLLFASIMFGLSLYYLRIPFYGVLTSLKAHWQTAALAGTIIGVVLSAIWIIVPRLQNSKVSMILPTAILGVGIFATSQWLTSTPSLAGQSVAHHVYKTEAEGFAAAKAAGKPILIDMWAEWCEACKKMDVTTFVDPKVLETLDRDWISIKLDLTEDNAVDQEIIARYGLQGLPTLVMLPPDANLAEKKMLTSYVSATQLLDELAQFEKNRKERAE